jgi:hypothetical protein
METIKKNFILPLFGYVAFAVILGSIVGGLLITGGPDRQRLIRFDQTRAHHLNSIESKIQQYFREKNRLPAQLADVNGFDSNLDANGLPVDPVTKQSYSYLKVNDFSFKICATFQTELLPSPGSNFNGDYYFRSLRYHKQGLQCVSKTLKAPTISHD